MTEPAGVGGRARSVGRPADSDSAATRLHLLHAAIGCFAKRGLARTTLRDISGAAGLTPGTLYHHYPTKEALYVAAYRWSVEEMYGQYEQAVVHLSGVRDRLVAVLYEDLRLMRTRPELMDFVLRAWVEHDDTSGPLPIPDAVLRFVDRLAADAIRAGEIDEDQRAQLLSVYRAMLWGVAAISLTGRGNAEPTVEGFAQLIRGTLLAPERPARSGRRPASE
ncbi:MAG: TetR/AcrR family transcriptional regulator [Pseudonocardia sp.]|nr:TetR/AcrR family transcriptional regulator [Pseudonocardia sp.]